MEKKTLHTHSIPIICHLSTSTRDSQAAPSSLSCGKSSGVDDMVDAQKMQLSSEEKPGLTFGYTGSLIGVLIMVFHNPLYDCAVQSPFCYPSNQVFFRGSIGLASLNDKQQNRLWTKNRLKPKNEKNPKGIFSPMHPNFSGANLLLVFRQKAYPICETWVEDPGFKMVSFGFFVFCFQKRFYWNYQITRVKREKRMPYFFLVGGFNPYEKY